MKTLLPLLLMLGFTLNLSAQNPQGSWVITTPCDCPDKKEMTWQWTVKADGTFEVDIDVDGTIEVTGKYWVEGNKIIVQNNEGCTEKGTYEFTVDGEKLWMDPVEDACEGRKPPQKVFFTKA